jgi:2-polyprenyl-3-methyl-5-hydroxy-6-metoxy-1,4-benzoquinol methylase
MAKTVSIAEERVKPGAWLPPWTVAEHNARYNFAANFVSGKHVVDCACGNGVGTHFFIQRGPSVIYGFDLDEGAIQYASGQYDENNVFFEKISALPFPLPNGSIDVFICLETLEHIQDDNEFVREISRVLKPEGLLILSTPNRLITNPGLGLKEMPWNHFHVREYTPSELQAALENHFEIQDWYGQNKNLPAKVSLLLWVANFFGKKSAVILNQIMKCRWFFLPRKTTHLVTLAEQPHLYEYVVVTCRPRVVK